MKIADSTQFFPFLCLSLSLHFQEGTTFFVFLRGQSSSCGAISLSGTRITNGKDHFSQLPVDTLANPRHSHWGRVANSLAREPPPSCSSSSSSSGPCGQGDLLLQPSFSLAHTHTNTPNSLLPRGKLAPFRTASQDGHFPRGSLFHRWKIRIFHARHAVLLLSGGGVCGKTELFFPPQRRTRTQTR